MTAAGLTIRRCRPDECGAVLALWTRAGAIPSPTDTPEALARLVRSEHGDGFLVALRDGSVVGTVIGGFDGWRGAGFLHGSPADVVADLGRWRELGVQRVMLQMIDQEDLAAIELIAREVLPALGSR